LGDTWHLDELFHGVILNLFRAGGHLLRPANHRLLRGRAFLAWSEVTCA
jgi:hypothetical protein